MQRFASLIKLATNALFSACQKTPIYSRRIYFVFTISIIVGFSRVYVGVHYPFDVLGGWIFGFGLAWGILSIWVILKMREIKRGRTWINYL